MHEWALAEAVVKTARRIAVEEGLGNVTAVTVSLGELQQIDPAIFEQALNEIAPHFDPRLSNARFHLQVERVCFRCRACGREWSWDDVDGSLSPEDLEAVHFMPEVAASRIRCPGCQGSDFEVLRGRGVSVVAVTGEA